MTVRFFKKFDTATLPLLLVVASFGPYLSQSVGVRADQAMIYLCTLLALAVTLLRRQESSVYRPILVMVMSLVVATALTTVTTVELRAYESVGKALSHFNRYVQATVTLVSVWVLMKTRDREESRDLLRKVCKLTVLMLALNSLLSVASVFTDVTPVTGFFLRATDGMESTVAYRAATMGRRLGIFNQPMEAGGAYSLAVFAWGYLFRKDLIKLSFTWILALFLLVVGGCLTISKVFILVGFPLFLGYWVSRRTLKRIMGWKFVALALVASLVLASLVMSLLDSWAEKGGLDYFLRLFSLRDMTFQEMLYLYTAGRYGGDSNLIAGAFSQVWARSPLVGLGFAAETVFDNGYLEFFCQGGVLGLLCCIVMKGVCLWNGLVRFLKGSEEGRLLLVISLQMWLAAFGGPVLTSNRTSTCLFVFIAAIFNVFWAEAPQRRRAPQGSAAPLPLDAVSQGA